MSNPSVAPRIKINEQLMVSDMPPDAYFKVSDEKEWKKSVSIRDLNKLQTVFEDLDMELAPPFYIPKDMSCDRQVLQSPGPTLARAPIGRPELRVRSGAARLVTRTIWKGLPATGSFYGRDKVGAAMKDKFFADGGANMFQNRLRQYYPKRGAEIVRPTTAAEAKQALINCGLQIDHLPDHAIRPYPLISTDVTMGVKVNPKSGNGFPVGGKWEQPEAQAMAMQMAVAVRKELRAASALRYGVRAWYKDAMETRPWLVAFAGRCKADYYSQEKIEKQYMRYYNCPPRQLVLNMQVATQPFEALAKHATQGDGSHSAIGETLVRGGSARLVAVLNDMLSYEGKAYLHVGDDSWVVVRLPGERLMSFALDCSSFDLTQHSDTTLEIHKALRRQLALIDGIAADLWYECARKRLVVMTSTLVREWTHAGPSGLVLQSKVNDMCMDVLIQRTLKQVDSILERGLEITEAGMNTLLNTVGKEMGFVIKVEQFEIVDGERVEDLLYQKPFQFIGNYFHVIDGFVHSCVDLPRMMAQVPYPGLKWVKGDHEHEVMEAMRLGSIMMNLGIPPKPLTAAFDEARKMVYDFIEATIRAHGDRSDNKLRWAVAESPFGADTEACLSGLARALARDPGELWSRAPERELPAESNLVPVEGTSWAEQTELEEMREREALGVPEPPAPVHMSPLRLFPAKPRTQFKVTKANDGRPPPVTPEWGPNKPKRRRATRVGNFRKGGVLEDEIEMWEEMYDQQDADKQSSYYGSEYNEDDEYERDEPAAWEYATGNETFSMMN